MRTAWRSRRASVCLAAATRGGDVRRVERHYGDIGRGEVRYRAVEEGMALVERRLARD